MNFNEFNEFPNYHVVYKSKLIDHSSLSSREWFGKKNLQIFATIGTEKIIIHKKELHQNFEGHLISWRNLVY